MTAAWLVPFFLAGFAVGYAAGFYVATKAKDENA